MQDNCEPLPKPKGLWLPPMTVAFGGRSVPVVFRYKEPDPHPAYKAKVSLPGAGRTKGKMTLRADEFDSSGGILQLRRNEMIPHVFPIPHELTDDGALELVCRRATRERGACVPELWLLRE